MINFRRVVVAMMVTTTLLTACTSAPAAPIQGLPGQAPAHHVFLFRHSTNRVILYNMGDGTEVKNGDQPPQTFQYQFPNGGRLLTSGDSEKFGFKLIDRTNESLTTLLELGPREALFPVVSSDVNHIFQRVGHDERGAPTSAVLMSWSGTQLTTLTELPASAVRGAILGDRIFVTMPDPVDDSSYLLARTSLGGGDLAVEQRGLQTPRLATWRGSLVVEDTVPGSAAPLPCDYHCTFREDRGDVLALAPNSQGDLTLTSVNPSTSASRELARGSIIDFTWDDTTTTVYLDGSTKEVEG